MNEKLDAFITKIGDTLDTWLEEFQSNPVRTAIKVLLILYVVKVAKRALRDLR